MIDKDYAREMTKMSLSNELSKIYDNYIKVYDEYYSDENTRDSAFLKDLVDSIQGISAVLEVYVEQKGIHPDYVIEKLEWSKSIIQSVINYYEHKLKEEKDNDR